MAKSLVIVESPAKAKTIQKYLGRGYTVKASMGHVRDLPKNEIGVDIEHGFAPTYTTLKDRAKVLAALRTSAKDADTVYLAPDPDREGEAIAWHVAQALKLPDKKVRRVTFNEITQRAIRDAFQHPTQIDMARVNAQQARRILDRIVGYQLSPLLWKKVAKGLSAGRVQSVAVRLIVEREKEIRAFKPEEFWQILAKLAPQGGNAETESFTAELATWKGKKFRPAKGEEAQAVAESLRGAGYAVAAVERKQQKTAPGPPFNTSLLQQQASVLLHFATKRTMRIAQQLYEGIELGPDGSAGLITYMRTDSFRMSSDAVQECRSLIQQQFGDRYLHGTTRAYKAKKGAQEAHEAIRPTSVARTPEQVKPFLTPEQHRLYDLIWRRFVATQMSEALYDVTDVDISAAEGLFKAKGRVCRFDGHTRLTGSRDEKDVQNLPPLEVGKKLDLVELNPSQHFTKPPGRYTEASLVRTLEREGIGRPSTYAAIISTIQDRGYVKQEKRAFFATDLGIVVTDLLVISFPDIMNVQFTSGMEEKLDKIEEDHIDWVAVLDEFYKVFKADLEKAGAEMQKVKGIEVAGEVCPDCGKPLLERWSKFGKFLGCSGYPECKYIKKTAQAGGEEAATDVVCDKCGKPMVLKASRRGNFLGCSGYPECKNTRDVGRDGQPLPAPEPTDKVCEKCDAPMIIRTTGRGRYLACSAYPKCRNMLKLGVDGTPLPPPEKTDQVCDKCGSPMLIRTGKRGRFLACSAFPKCRNAKPLPGEAGAKAGSARGTRRKSAGPPPEPTGEVCEKCGKPMIIRSGSRGKSLGCSGYPKCRSTKNLPAEETPAKEE